MTRVKRSERRYVPALGCDRLTGLYDPLVRLTLPELAFKRRLLEQARLVPGFRVLDVGCGTATLLLLAESAALERATVGLDGDARVLGLAARKVRRGAARIRLVQGLAFDLPFAEGSFDRVLSTMTLHHLTRAEKEATLAETLRILRPGGELHVADWGRPHNLLMRLPAILVAIGEGRERTADNLAGRLPGLLARAGFEEVAQVDRFATIFGTLALYRGRKPGRSRGSACS